MSGIEPENETQRPMSQHLKIMLTAFVGLGLCVLLIALGFFIAKSERAPTPADDGTYEYSYQDCQMIDVVYLQTYMKTFDDQTSGLIDKYYGLDEDGDVNSELSAQDQAKYHEELRKVKLDENRWVGSLMYVLAIKKDHSNEEWPMKERPIVEWTSAFINTKDSKKAFDGSPLSDWSRQRFVDVGNRCRASYYTQAIEYIPEVHTPGQQLGVSLDTNAAASSMLFLLNSDK